MELKNLSGNLKSQKNELQNISIDLFPSKKQSQWWNKCFNNTSLWFNKKGKNLEGLDKATKESLAVDVCNGVVYEPTPKIKLENHTITKTY